MIRGSFERNDVNWDAADSAAWATSASAHAHTVVGSQDPLVDERRTWLLSRIVGRPNAG
jgi:hypothetical protein